MDHGPLREMFNSKKCWLWVSIILLATACNQAKVDKQYVDMLRNPVLDSTVISNIGMESVYRTQYELKKGEICDTIIKKVFHEIMGEPVLISILTYVFTDSIGKYVSEERFDKFTRQSMKSIITDSIIYLKTEQGYVFDTVRSIYFMRDDSLAEPRRTLMGSVFIPERKCPFMFKNIKLECLCGQFFVSFHSMENIGTPTLIVEIRGEYTIAARYGRMLVVSYKTGDTLEVTKDVIPMY